MKIVAIFLLAGCSLANPGFSQAKLGFFTSFDGTRIYYEVSGKGYPVLLLHGFMNNGSDWKKIPLYDSLLKTGYKVITADLRGNGKSGKPHTPEAYADDAEAKDLVGLITYLRVKKYAVVGYSRGSIIATRVLVLDKRSKRSVLGGMGADFTNPQWPRRIAFYEAMMNDSVPGFDGARKRIKEQGLDQLALAYQQKGQPSTSHATLAKLKQKVMVICSDQDLEILFLGLFI